MAGPRLVSSCSTVAAGAMKKSEALAAHETIAIGGAGSRNENAPRFASHRRPVAAVAAAARPNENQ